MRPGMISSQTRQVGLKKEIQVALPTEGELLNFNLKMKTWGLINWRSTTVRAQRNRNSVVAAPASQFLGGLARIEYLMDTSLPLALADLIPIHPICCLLTDFGGAAVFHVNTCYRVQRTDF